MIRGYQPAGSPTNRLTALVIQRLSLAGHYVWRNNTGRKGGVAFGEPGSADVIGLSNRGRFLAIEVKATKRDRLKSDQVSFRERVESRGGLYYECRAFEQFDTWCREVGL